MATTTLTKAEILNETINYYSEDINRRAVTYDENKKRRCTYNTEDNNHCAVGRCFTDNIKSEGINFELNNYSIEDLNECLTLDNILQPQYKGHHLSFWSMLQDLHDDNDHWNENGLSEQGEELVEQIKRVYCILD